MKSCVYFDKLVKFITLRITIIFLILILNAQIVFDPIVKSEMFENSIN